MTVARYRMAAGRELRTTRTHGRIFLAVHLLGGATTSGSMAIREDELDALRSALADLAGETGSSEATEPAIAATRTPSSGRATP